MIDENEIQSSRRLLGEIADMCEHATLTGSLEGGEPRTAQRYNALLKRLIESQLVPSGLFSSLPDNSKFGEIGVEAKMLASYLPSNKLKDKGGDNSDRNIIIRLAPFVHKEELAMLIRDHASKGGGLDVNTLSSLAPFLGSDMLSELLRDHLAKSTADVKATAPQPPTPPKPPAQPASPTSPSTSHISSEFSTSLAIPKNDFPEPIGDQGESVEDLLALLKSPYLSDDERSDAVERLRLLSRS